MYKNMFIILLLAGFGLLLGSFLLTHHEYLSLPQLPAYYADNTAPEVGAANVVTAVVVTYRGFDTLGEVTILFVAASLIAMFLKHSKALQARPSSTAFFCYSFYFAEAAVPIDCALWCVCFCQRTPYTGRRISGRSHHCNGLFIVTNGQSSS